MTKEEYKKKLLSRLENSVEFKQIEKISYNSPEETLKHLTPSLLKD
jgi:hypothetical protein